MEGLLGLSQNINTAESGMRELAVLERMDQRVQSDRNAEVQAQQQEQLMYEQMYAVAGTMLEKDRKNMNKRIQKSQMALRSHLAKTGGSRKDFQAQGGISVMNNMKNDIMQSDEAITMQENQKNLAKILEADAKGLGHLISPADRRSVEQYNEMESGGKISFNGMMAEIKIPPSDAFDYGSEIPISKIISHDSNMIKLLHNYGIAHPDEPKLDPINNKKDYIRIVEFVKEQGYGGQGTNTIRIREASLAARQRAEYEKKTSTKTANDNWLSEATSVTSMIPEFTMTDLMEGGKYEKYGGIMGYLNQEKPKSKALFKEKSTLISKKRSMSEPGSLYNKDINMENGLDALRFDKWAYEGVGEIYDAMFATDVGLKESYQFMEMSTQDIAAALYPPATDGTTLGYTYENGILKEFQPTEKMFRADGTRLTGKNKLDEGQTRGDYEPLGVYTALKHKAGSDDGETSLLVNAYDDDGNIDKIKTAEFDKMAAGKKGGSGISMTYVMALKAKDGGDIYYEEIDLSQVDKRAIISEAVGTTAASGYAEMAKSENKALAIEDQMKAISDEQQAVFNTEMREIDDSGVWDENGLKEEGQTWWGAGGAGALNRHGLMKSMYLALDNQINQSKPPAEQGIHTGTLQKLVSRKDFGTNMVHGFGEEADKILRDYSIPEDQIIDQWFNGLVKANDWDENDLSYKQNLQLAATWKKLLKMQEEQPVQQ